MLYVVRSCFLPLFEVVLIHSVNLVSRGAELSNFLFYFLLKFLNRDFPWHSAQKWVRKQVSSYLCRSQDRFFFFSFLPEASTVLLNLPALLKYSGLLGQLSDIGAAFVIVVCGQFSESPATISFLELPSLSRSAWRREVSITMLISRKSDKMATPWPCSLRSWQKSKQSGGDFMFRLFLGELV